MDAVWAPSSGWTRLIACCAEQTRQTLAVAEDSVAAAAGAVLGTLPITISAEETCHECTTHSIPST